MNRRTPILITYEVLSVLHKFGKMNISQLCLRTRLSHQKLRMLLDTLINANFIARQSNGGSDVYVLTPKGRKMFLKLKEYIEVLAEAGLIKE